MFFPNYAGSVRDIDWCHPMLQLHRKELYDLQDRSRSHSSKHVTIRLTNVNGWPQSREPFIKPMSFELKFKSSGHQLHQNVFQDHPRYPKWLAHEEKPLLDIGHMCIQIVCICDLKNMEDTSILLI